MTNEEFLDGIKQTFGQCYHLAALKNQDYAGPGDPFRNFKMASQVGVSPERAILVRVSDKISRISTLLDSNPAIVDEAIDDSIRDVINYMAILRELIFEKKQEGATGPCEK